MTDAEKAAKKEQGANEAMEKALQRFGLKRCLAALQAACARRIYYAANARFWGRKADSIAALNGTGLND